MAFDLGRLRKEDLSPHTISDEGRQLLEKYAGIPAHKVDQHVISVVRHKITHIPVRSLTMTLFGTEF